MGPRLAIDPATYEAASLAFGTEIAGRVTRAALGLLDELGGCAAMAGADPAGRSWADAYDDAAALTVGVTSDVVNGCYQLAELLQQTGFNYSRAESHSTPGVIGPLPDRTFYAGFGLSLAPPPSAAGGTVQARMDALGAVECDGHTYGWHQDRLRAAAAAWSAAAAAIADSTPFVYEALECISSQVSPEVDDAMTACRAMDEHLWALVGAYRSMASACSDFAGHIDKAHSDALNELMSLLEWTAGIQVAGGVLAFFTAGLSEIPAQLAQLERVAVTAAKVRSIIVHLIDMARVVAESISAATARVVQVSRNLKGLLGTRLSVATAHEVGQLPEVLTTAEQVAVKRAAHRSHRLTFPSYPRARAPSLSTQLLVPKSRDQLAEPRRQGVRVEERVARPR